MDRQPLYKRIHRDQLLKTLGLPGKIPPDFCGVFPNTPVYEWYAEYHYQELDKLLGRAVQMARTEKPWAQLTIVIQPAHAHTPKHRIFFQCTCGRLIPIGRSHQHLPACKRWPNLPSVEISI